MFTHEVVMVGVAAQAVAVLGNAGVFAGEAQLETREAVVARRRGEGDGMHPRVCAARDPCRSLVPLTSFFLMRRKINLSKLCFFNYDETLVIFWVRRAYSWH